MLVSPVGLTVIWSGVFPALGILDSVELWHYTGGHRGRRAGTGAGDHRQPAGRRRGRRGGLAAVACTGLLEILLRQKMGVRPASAYAVTRVFQYACGRYLVALVISSLGGSWSQIQWSDGGPERGHRFRLQENRGELHQRPDHPVRATGAGGRYRNGGQVSGRVTKIQISATTIRDSTNREPLVPNRSSSPSNCSNWSLSDQVTRWVLEVGVAYGTDLEKAMGLISDIIHRHPQALSHSGRHWLLSRNSATTAC